MKQTGPFRIIALLLLIFLASVAIRLPNINRPLSKHHEFVTAVALIVIDNWDTQGASSFNFSPVMNFPGYANKYINNWASTTGEMIDDQGNYYYVSHPPFAYIFPYTVFKILHIKPSVLSIEIFNLFTNLISALFIYFIICLLGQQKPLYKIYWSGVVGFAIYLFSTGVLWFQSNTYMSDMLVHSFFIINVYIMLKLLMRKKYYSPKYLIYFSIFLFLMVYTSWLGIFFAFSVFIYSFIKLRKELVFIPLNLLALFVSATAVLLFVFQYSHINGIEAYFNQMLQRVGERGSFHENLSFFTQIKRYILSLISIIKTYITSYLPLFLLLLSFAFLVVKKAKLRIVFTKNGYRFLWLSVLPVLLLHLSLSNYSGHDFVSLYGSLFLSVLIAILYDKLKEAKTLNNYVLNGGVMVVIFSSIFMYYLINRPGKYSWKGDYYAQSMELGKQIAETAKADEVVFAMGKAVIDPQLIYYAKRNIKKVNSEQEAIDFLKERKIENGIIYFSENIKDNQFSNIIPISIK